MKSLDLVFHMEPADHSVGIMAEGFSAWDSGGKSWCDMLEFAEPLDRCKFEWYDNETGEKCEPPGNAKLVERFLYMSANNYYDFQADVWSDGG